MALIETLTSSVPMEIRTSSEEYLEAVVKRQHLEGCLAILAEALGPPAKPLDGTASLAPDEKAFVDSKGGVRGGQGLFLRKDGEGRFAFALLWPWSNPENVTLKVGVPA